LAATKARKARNWASACFTVWLSMLINSSRRLSSGSRFQPIPQKRGWRRGRRSSEPEKSSRYAWRTLESMRLLFRNWLGHARLDTTNLYARANLGTTQSTRSKPPRWKQDPELLTWPFP
jgi:hypothetical protein